TCFATACVFNCAGAVHSRSNSSLGSQPFKYRHPAYVVGASLTMVTYLAWVWNSNPRHIPKYDLLHRNVGPSLSSEQVLSAATASETASSNTATPSTEKTDLDAIPPDAQDKGENQEDSSDGQGAFNPETEAFSCFVYSDKEPKGIDCVEKFKAMQDCFRAHPDVYGEEILDDEDENAETTSEASIQSDHAPPSNPPSPKDREQPAPATQTS
ncbi:hypothetical protein BKA83DRAFT_4238820, partial [Pisolithus microcarpus]